MDILCEINIGNEATKSGVSPEEAPAFVQELMKFSNLRVCGLMCIPPVCDKKEEQKKYFKKIMKIFIDITHKNMDNSIGMRAEITLQFKEKLEKNIGLEVIMVDERLTSVISNQVLIEANMSRKKRKKKVDGLAAVLILQSYLDRIKK